MHTSGRVAGLNSSRGQLSYTTGRPRKGAGRHNGSCDGDTVRKHGQHWIFDGRKKRFRKN